MEKTCSRCGEEITITERVRNNRQFKILGRDYMLHFCDDCYCIIVYGGEKSCHI